MSSFNIAPATLNILTRANFSISSATTTTVQAAVTGAILRVYRMLLVNGGAAQTVQLQDGAANALSGLWTFATGSSGTPVVLDHTGDPWFVCAISQSFQVVTTTSGAVGGSIWFTQTASP